MLQPSPAPAESFAERLRTGVGRRALAIVLALLIEALLLVLLLTFGGVQRPGTREQVVTVATLNPDDASEEPPQPKTPEPAQGAEQPPLEQPPPREPPLSPSAEPLPPQPARPTPVPNTPALLPTPNALPPSPIIPRSPTRPAPPAGQIYGPPDTGGGSSSAALRDTERVGTAPNGEPLYAAAWHREPRPDALRAYMSTANGPGWGLIACRTAPNYRVEDCVPLDEYPSGSQINRAILAAAWEFEVRPPRRGGRLLVGSWVRIRIDYRRTRR